jgi:hypothetical protein
MNRNSERGDFRFGPIAGLVIIALALIGLFAICSDDNDEIDGYAPVQLVDHEYDDGDRYRYEEDSGGSGDRRGGDGRYAGGRSGDYDGGPGDDCRTGCNNTIIIPAPGGNDDEREQR